jgi:hypothetical protein
MCIITGLAAKRSVQRDKPSKSRGEAFLKMEHAKYSVAFLASYTLGGLKFPQVAGRLRGHRYLQQARSNGNGDTQGTKQVTGTHPFVGGDDVLNEREGEIHGTEATTFTKRTTR